jgi:His/Glu/Gln/Arg/opine family amino acid ABC transporter permease subunit
MNLSLLADPALWPAMLTGLQVTAIITVLSIGLGLLLALPIAAARSEGRPWLRALATGYVFVFRGVPLLMLLYLLYYGAGQLGWLRASVLWDLVFKSALATVILAFTLSNAAYLAEALRGGISTVAPGAREAGLAIGLTPSQVFTRITLPIGFRNSVLTMGNEVVFTIKASVIASIVTVRDVLAEAQRVGATYADNLTPLLAAAAVFIALVQAVEWAVRWTDRRLNAGSKYDAGGARA